MQLKLISKSASTVPLQSRPVSLSASQGGSFCCVLRCGHRDDESHLAGYHADAGRSCSHCFRGVDLCHDGCYCPGESGVDRAGQTNPVARGYRPQHPGAAACSAGKLH